MNDIHVAVVGLGYVGLPLVVALSRKFPVIGFDISPERVSTLKSGVDYTGEIESQELTASNIRITDDVADLAGSNFFIVTVPTPIDQANRPDFGALLKACELIGPRLSVGRDRRVRDHRLSRRDRGDCAPGAGDGFRPEVRDVDFKLGYSPGAHQSRRQGASAREDHQGRRGAGRARRCDCVAEVYGAVIEAGMHQALVDQGRRSRQGHREHPARPQHRADERAGA